MSQSLSIRLARLITLITFILESVIFILYLITSIDEIVILGAYFIVCGGLVNLIVFLFIIFKAIIEKDQRKKLILNSMLMLINVPLVIVYGIVIFIIGDTLRIDFKNCTGTTIHDVNIVGCENEHIDKLEIGESETIWIRINDDYCDLEINYVSEGKRINEKVVGEFTFGMGQKHSYKIDGYSKELEND